MSTLLLIAIGPVQDFIAAGRTTRDLWFGSALLSQVGRRIAFLLRESGAALIFPASASLDDDAASVPNRIFAEVTAGDISAVVAAARAAAQAVLDGYREDIERRFPDAKFIDWDVMRSQVDDFLEFYAAWVPYDPARPETYPARRAQVERLLGGRKALRDFAPPAGIDGRAKSALDPSRESVILPGATAEQRARLRLKGAEELDALSLIKRLAAPETFPSISRVALDPFIRRAAGSPGLAALAEQARLLAQVGAVDRFDTSRRWSHYAAFPYNTTLLYDEGRIDDPMLEQNQDAVTAAQRFFETADRLRRDLKIDGLPDYFAILVADGDRMGPLISTMDTPGAHRRLSTGLARFATEAETIVRNHHGALIYAGGDDVLAFLPLDDALACADALRRAFAKTVGEAAGGRTVTLSAGLAIVHAVEHLQHALTWARDAEQAAKRERNSLAVAFHPRSGSGYHLTVSHRWDDPVDTRWDDPVGARWQPWINDILAGAISMGSLYELRQLSRELRGQSSTDITLLLRSEVPRILRRKKQRDGTPVSEATVTHLLTLIGQTLESLDAAVNVALIARRIAEAVAVSRPDADTREKVPA